VASGRLDMAIDAHERLGLAADPTQALVLRTNDWPRGELRSYDVHEVSPSQLQPSRSSTHMHTHARTHARALRTYTCMHAHARAPHAHAHTHAHCCNSTPLSHTLSSLLLLQLTLMEEPPSDHLSPLATSPPLPLTFPPTPPRPPRHPYRFIPLLSEPANLLSPSPLSSARRSRTARCASTTLSCACATTSRSRRPPWTRERP
jgi:hypothetical protein